MRTDLVGFSDPVAWFAFDQCLGPDGSGFWAPATSGLCLKTGRSTGSAVPAEAVLAHAGAPSTYPFHDNGRLADGSLAHAGGRLLDGVFGLVAQLVRAHA